MTTINQSASRKRTFDMDSLYQHHSQTAESKQPDEAGSLVTEANSNDSGSEYSLELSKEDKSDSNKKARLNFSLSSTDIREELEKKPLPNPELDVSPNVFLLELVKSLYGCNLEVKPALELDHYFTAITEERIAAYDVSAVTATRTNNLEDLKGLHFDGKRLDCCNRFGESLLHMACRRGFVDIGKFLLNEADLTVRITDDCGRNPFHDICWNPKIEVELATEVLRRDPTLLLVGDKRGHTPFDYSRRQDWSVWRHLLLEKRELLKPLQDVDTIAIFQSQKSGQV
mmetsp:Transcript_16392/g.24798  ORF Transcript_16392/g.24798 Transcript_16392/m.24798 type:complete len:285 (+) Transcript_16392:184-1038(+)